MTEVRDLPDERLTSREALEDFALRDDYALNPRFVEMVQDALEEGDSPRLQSLLEALRPEDVADLTGFLDPDRRADLIAALQPALLAEVLPELDDRIREEVLARVEPGRLARAIQELDSDDAVAVVEDLDPEQREAVLSEVPDVDRAAIESSLAHEEETAGRLSQREVVAAPQFWTIGQTIDFIRSTPDILPDRFFDVYVVDPAFKPVGAVALSKLLRCPRKTPLTELMEEVTEVSVDQDQEEVAYVFEKYGLISAPVVDAAGRLVGQITVDDVIDVIQEESQEDILALGGVGDVGRDAGILGITRSRLPWLAVNLLTAMVAATVISAFEGSIEKLVALAVLMPIVASIGGNAGTQAMTVTVRSLAMRELNAANAFRIFRREVVVGFMNGFALAPLLGVAAGVWFHSLALGLVIAAAMVLNLLVAALVGVLAPMTLDRMGRDPAVSSGVFVTAMTDIFGFLIFLGLATLVLL